MTNFSLKQKVIKGLSWKLLERFASQGISFIIQIILARLLLPEEFGIMAIISLLFIFFNTFVEGGFSRSLIQKREADDIDLSSVFWLNLLLASVAYAILFFCAPYISEFYQSPQLILLIRVFSVNMFIGALYNVQSSILIKEMEFKKLFFRNFAGTLFSGFLGVSGAYLGFGIWSLVIQQTARNIIYAISILLIVPWRPSRLIRMDRAKSLFQFGWKLLISTTIFNIQHQIRSLIIGKSFSLETLGYYNRGNQFPELIVENVNGAVQAVLFPAFSKQQGNLPDIKNTIRQSVTSTAFLIFPILMCLAAVAEPLTELLLTEKWLPSVPYIRLMAIASLLTPIGSYNLQAIIALGHSDIDLKLGLMKLFVNIVVLIIAIPYGLIAVTWGILLTTYFGAILSAYPNRKLLGYSFREQFSDIFPIFLLSLVVAAAVYSVQYFHMPLFATILIQFIFGTALYITLARVFMYERLKYMWVTLKIVIDPN